MPEQECFVSFNNHIMQDDRAEKLEKKDPIEEATQKVLDRQMPRRGVLKGLAAVGAAFVASYLGGKEINKKAGEPRNIVEPKNEPTEKGPGACLILSDKECNSGELVIINYDNDRRNIVGFNLEPGTPIFAPQDGDAYYNDLDNGLLITLLGENPHGVRFSLHGDVRYDKKRWGEEPILPVKKGQILGFVAGEKKVDSKVGDYNFIASASRIEEGREVTDHDALQKTFPEAFEKAPAKTINFKSTDIV